MKNLEILKSSSFPNKLNAILLHQEKKETVSTYHKHKRRNICERPENTAERSEGRTSLILVFGHCKLQ